MDVPEAATAKNDPAATAEAYLLEVVEDSGAEPRDRISAAATLLRAKPPDMSGSEGIQMTVTLLPPRSYTRERLGAIVTEQAKVDPRLMDERQPEPPVEDPMAPGQVGWASGGGL